jgi:RimJ/RimL family protein N-acetyltransferase
VAVARNTWRVPQYPQPTLTNGRLTLRPPREGDIPALVEACQDPEIPRWTRVPSPYTETHAREWLESPFEGVRLAITDAEDRFVGTTALMEIDEERSYAEIGYWVAAQARRQGVASGAAALLRDWAAEELGLTLIEIVVHRDNQASLRVPPRAGFTATGEMREAPERLGRKTDPVYAVFAWSAS